ncbi:cysteine desulfurase family protein [Anaerosolibacter carboniphilus]|uniref:cysteine desulfurase n=1 Tax=Anaerosolibacter carboniphilus TaxID=1417629 RepID=A0A841KY48_9FIRM|nr:aminotransferase class V-fold PLP-dependent enzyme [Anaerosolibacter carboniphilus]MBB6215079.1 cysteine desulfurase family protein [Anaerosolibacter carboniphilus]
MIYFDNAATTFPKPNIVYDELDRFSRNSCVSPSRGQYKLARETNIILKDTRDKIKELFQCKLNQEVVLNSSATESLNTILQGLDWGNIENIYVSCFEHNSILRVIHQLQKIYKFKVIEIPMEKGNGFAFDIEGLKDAFHKDRPDLLIISYVSNAFGVIAPLKEISNVAKQYECIILVDAAQAAGLLDINLKEIDIDFLVFSAHKTLYGPFGVAGFICDSNTQIKSLLYGGTGKESISMEGPSNIPDRYEVGSHNILAIAGLNSSLRWIRETGRENIEEKVRLLTDELSKCLNEFKQIITYEDKIERNQISVIACNFKGYDADSMGMVLDEYGIAVRTGLHCAPNAHKIFNTLPSGTVRFSIGYFNTIQDISDLHGILKSIVKQM